jgi:hypothetical protein
MHITKKLLYYPFSQNKLTQEITLNINSTKRVKRPREERVEIDKERREVYGRN